ncbi:Uncharacterised protein [Achromobacter xylosoxidans]|nr:Uncharacterised protein [Achromobacter xylosoxidans]
MLGAGLGGADPRHLRQGAIEHVLAQLVQAAGGQRLVLERGQRARHAVVSVAVGLEARGRVERVVVRHVLVDAPADAGALQAFGIGGPGVGAGRIAAAQLVVGVAQRRPVAAPQAVVGAAPEEQPIRIGAAGERAVVGVAHGEGARHGVLERHVGLGVVRHRMVLLGGRPLAHAAGVPGVLGVGPGVRRAGHAHGLVGRAGVEPERQHAAGRAGIGTAVVLRPDRAAFEVGTGGHRDGKAVAEAAHPGEAAEVMVERTVFLHEDDDVLDVLDRALAAVGGNRQRAADGGGQQRQGAAGAGDRGAAAQEFASGLHAGGVLAGCPCGVSLSCGAVPDGAARSVAPRGAYCLRVLSA